MPVVYTSFIFFTVIAFLGSHSRLKCFNTFFFFSLLLFVVAVVGLRSEYVGADSLQYYFSFKELNLMSLPNALATRYAYGYVLWTRFIGLFSKSPYVFFFVTALITLSVYFAFLKRYSKDIFLSILVFFCLNWTAYITVTRQSYAVSAILLGLPFLLQKRYAVFLLFVFVAMQLHSSALVATILIPLSKLKMNRKVLVAFGSISIVLFVATSLVWSIVYKYGGVYALYGGGMFDTTGTSVANDFVIKVFPSLCIFCLALIATSNKRNEEENFFLLVCLLNLCIGIVGLKSLIITRLNGYFDFANPIVLSYFLTSSKIVEKKTKWIITLGLIFFFIALFTIIQIERPYWMKITPYSPFWAPVNVYGMNATRYFW